MAFVPLRRRSTVQQAFGASSENLGNRVISGASAMFIGMVIRTLITVASVAVLARLLTPADFGHVAMATVITEFASLFANFGFGSILIQRKRVSRLQLDTVFWVSLAMGCVLTLVVLGLSFFSGLLFADPISGKMLQVMCWSFLLDQMTVVPNSLLTRMMRFRTLLVLQVVVMIFRTTVAVGMAWQGFSYWSLAVGPVAAAVLQIFLYQRIVGYWPRARFNFRFVAASWKINGGYWLSGFIYYVNSNADLVILGRLFGATTLGYYQNARSLADEVGGRISTPLQRVLFPAFAAIQHDTARYQEALAKSCRLISMIILPIGFGIAAVAEELVPVLYGQQWLPMIPILKVIAIGSAIRAAASISTPVYNSLNKVEITVPLNIISLVLFILALTIGSHWGIIGVTYALLLHSVYSLIVLRIAFSFIGLDMWALFAAWGPPLIAASLMFVTVSLARPFCTGMPVPLQLASLIFTGAAIYVTAVFVTSKKHVGDVLSVVKRG